MRRIVENNLRLAPFSLLQLPFRLRCVIGQRVPKVYRRCMIAARNFGLVQYSEIKYFILHFVFYGIAIIGLFDIRLLCGYIGLATK